MQTSQIPIYNTLSWQEKIVMFLVSMLYFLQPFEILDHRTVVFILAAIGTWILLFHKWIYKRASFWQYTTVFALLTLPGIISFWNTHNAFQTTKFSLAVPALFAAGAAIYSLLTNKVAVKILICTIAITSTAWALDGIFQSIFEKDIVGIPRLFGTLQVTGPFRGSTHLGILLTVTLPVSLKWYSRFGWVPQIVYVLLIGYVLLLTGVRTDWVTFLVAIFLFYVCVTGVSKLLLLKLIPALIVISAGAIAISPLTKEKAVKFVSIPTTYEGWNQKLTNRVFIYATALNMGSQNLITGAGAKSFNDAYVQYKLDGDWIDPEHNGGAFHAHHPWLSIFAETGLIGLTSLLGAIVLLLVVTIKSQGKLNFYYYPWLLSLVLILNPVNSMLPLFEMWWFPVVLLVITSHIIDVEYSNRSIAIPE